jgi:hypothetical protein
MSSNLMPSTGSQDTLSSVGILEPVYPNAAMHLNMADIERTEKNVLLLIGTLRFVNHHVHRHASIDVIHKDVELVETADGAVKTSPECEKQAHSRERFLATAKHTGIFVVALPLCAGLIVGAHLSAA